MMGSSRALAGIRLWAMVLAIAVSAASAQTSATADQVKAAYILKFGGYVDWPASAFRDDDAPLVVCVAGSDSVYDELARIAVGRPVQRRRVEVRRVRSPEQIGAAHVLFVGSEAWRDGGSWVQATRGKPIAVVTDAPRGLEAGALLAFVEVENRVRFEASVRAAELAHLQLSARLLAVAVRVYGANP
jgi:hypothetical protein